MFFLNGCGCTSWKRASLHYVLFSTWVVKWKLKLGTAFETRAKMVGYLWLLKVSTHTRSKIMFLFIYFFWYPDWNGFKPNLEQSSAATTGVLCSAPMLRISHCNVHCHTLNIVKCREKYCWNQLSARSMPIIGLSFKLDWRSCSYGCMPETVILSQGIRRWNSSIATTNTTSKCQHCTPFSSCVLNKNSYVTRHIVNFSYSLKRYNRCKPRVHVD